MNRPLQMVRAEIGVPEFQRWMRMRRLRDPDHGMHCLLVESFGRELAPKPFRVIWPRGGARGCLYGYGRATAEELRAAARTYADPLQGRILPPPGIDSKPMPAEWAEGSRLGFETRVRPIVRRIRNADCRPGKEWDAYQLEAMQHPPGEMPRSRAEVYTDWLARQLTGRGGASLEAATLQRCQLTRATRHRQGRGGEGPDALMQGILTVTDCQAFSELLARGLGRHRAYGYGMILLTPAA